jgi:hypothetical protein
MPVPNLPVSVETMPAPKPSEEWTRAAEAGYVATRIEDVRPDVTHERAVKHAALALAGLDPQQMRLLAYVAAQRLADDMGWARLTSLTPQQRLNRVRAVEGVFSAFLHAAAGYLPEAIPVARGQMQMDHEAARFSRDRSPELPEARIGRVSPRPMVDMDGNEIA